MLRLPGPRVAHGHQDLGDAEALAKSYRRLADIFHDVLAEESLESLLHRIADTLADLLVYDALTVFWADEERRLLIPVLSRDPWAQQVLQATFEFGAGVTGWAVEHRTPARISQLQLDPRSQPVPGTPDEPEALVSVPLVARGRVKGALNVYRLGREADFSDAEFELLKRFGDAAALALDNAEVRLRLEHQAQTDSLTGLFNHRAFHDRLRAEVAGCDHGSPVAVLMLDLDDFKHVNDVYGHAAGDLVLAELATMLRRTVRTTDVVCRIGGEEFAVILPGVDARSAGMTATRLAEQIGAASFGPVGRVTASMGIAHAPAHASGPRELAACAEAAMMTAKAAGKNQVVVFEDAGGTRPAAEPGRDARTLAHLKLLQTLVGRLNRSNEIGEIGEAIVEELATLIDYSDCRVYVRDGDELVPIASRGELGVPQEGASELLRCRVGEGVTGRCAELAQSVLVADTLACDFAVHIPGTPVVAESLLATPLLYAGEVAGVIVLAKVGVAELDEHDVRLLEVLAGHVAVAVENARLVAALRKDAIQARTAAERLERTLLATIEAVASALEARGGHESTHPKALAVLAVGVGETLGVDREARRRLELAALLHDVGTIGFPEGILVKPGPLTPDERSLLELHPELGERILASVDELTDIRTIVRHCHERWDGSGYPDGLAGEEIPLESRIVLVCDAYLAMTSDRPYRRRFSDGEAKAELQAGAGSQLDPRVVTALLDVLG